LTTIGPPIGHYRSWGRFSSTLIQMDDNRAVTTRIGIFYPSDPAGHVPSGIDSFVRGILQWAPPDLEYTLFGATSDATARPVGRETAVRLGNREIRYLPLVSVDPTAARSFIPLTVQYMRALHKMLPTERITALDILDFHRIEPSYLFRHDPRPKNMLLHQDMSVIRDKNSDIKWRHFPWLYESIERGLFNRLDRIFCVRQSAVERYSELYPTLADKFAFVPTWVDTSIYGPGGADDRDAARRQLQLGPVTKLLVFVGRLDRQKNPLLLLEAFRLAVQQQGDLRLILIGDGILRPQLEGQVNSNGLQGLVRLTGALSRPQIASMLRAADLFVMSSGYEGMPIAVLEALATGLPVVSTDVGELRRVVQDGVTGYLSLGHTPAALADAMVQALRSLDEMRGAPCESSVTPYHPEKVLGLIYENHLRQAAGMRRN
jgi:glycosyltransferase involved in cell wall biosynthesis